MEFIKGHAIGPFDFLIFDMDGVLINVFRSYRAAIQQTVQIYFETCFGLRKGQIPLVTQADISSLKSLGGFNNDWDLTTALLLYLSSIAGLPPRSRRKKLSSFEHLTQHLRDKSSKTSWWVSRLRKKHLPKFVEAVRATGPGLPGVRRALRKTTGASWEGWIYGSGKLDRENLVMRIFQEVYLGNQFVRRYRLRPIFYHGPGLHLREELLIPKQILAHVHRKVRMGIATGRPRFEARLTLKRFGILPYFESIVTLNDCEAEETRIFRSTGRRVKRSKPHPFSLLRVIDEIGIVNPRCAYIGDVIDDVQTALAAKRKRSMTAIGATFCPRNRRASKKELLEAGAERVLDRPEELPQLMEDRMK